MRLGRGCVVGTVGSGWKYIKIYHIQRIMKNGSIKEKRRKNI